MKVQQRKHQVKKAKDRKPKQKIKKLSNNGNELYLLETYKKGDSKESNLDFC